MPELGRYWADADSINPEPAQFWYVYRDATSDHNPAYLKGNMTHTENLADRLH